MNIRKIDRFTVEVYNAVIRLLPQLDSESVLPSKEHFKKILRSDRSHFFIAELDSRQIVGMLTIATYDIPSGTKVWIEDVVVDGSQREKDLEEN